MELTLYLTCRRFREWRDKSEMSCTNRRSHEKMLQQIKIRGRRFVFNFLTSMRRRLRPYWAILMACELANPCSPAGISDSAWDAVKDLCKRAGMSPTKIPYVVDEIKAQRVHYSRSSPAVEYRMQTNLLKFYADRIQSGDRRFPLCNEFAQIVFSIKVSSADIETYFSRTKYVKNIHRARLRDDVVSSTLHVCKTKKTRDKDALTVYDGSHDVTAAWKVDEGGQEDLTKKYVGGKVSKTFVDLRGVERAFIGEITHVHFVQSEAQYMMHVSYLSDSDSEDMEEWQVKDSWVGMSDD